MQKNVKYLFLGMAIAFSASALLQWLKLLSVTPGQQLIASVLFLCLAGTIALKK